MQLFSSSGGLQSTVKKSKLQCRQREHKTETNGAWLIMACVCWCSLGWQCGTAIEHFLQGNYRGAHARHWLAFNCLHLSSWRWRGRTVQDFGGVHRRSCWRGGDDCCGARGEQRIALALPCVRLVRRWLCQWEKMNFTGAVLCLKCRKCSNVLDYICVFCPSPCRLCCNSECAEADAKATWLACVGASPNMLGKTMFHQVFGKTMFQVPMSIHI